MTIELALVRTIVEPSFRTIQALKLKSVKRSPSLLTKAPVLFKTVRDTFASYRSSVERLLSSARHQHIVLPLVILWDNGES